MALKALTTERIFIPTDADFPTDDSDRQAEYLPANDIADIGARLIATCEELAHLHTATINYVWKREGGKSGGKCVLGKCTALSGYARFLSEADFLIWLAADHAREFGMTTAQLEALTYHELMHADVDPDNAKPKVRPHDVEMFVSEVERYGLWTSDLKDASDAMRQATLPMGLVPFGGKA